MTDMQKLTQEKERILSTIRMRGPCLPIHIAKSTGLSPLFASAFLSELFAEEKIKISNMRVGSSPLYFISGQEEKLENYIEHLNQKEREAFQRIKHFSVLEDEKLEPAIRVAIRAIKDFAIPTKAIVDGQAKLFWRYHLLTDQETKTKIQSIFFPQKEVPEEEKKDSIIPVETKPAEKLIQKPEITSAPETKQSEQELIKSIIPHKPIKKTEETEKPEEEIAKQKKTEKIEKTIERPVKKKPEKKVQKLEFPEKMKEYLIAKDIEILSSISEKKNEAIMKIRIDAPFGKQEYLLISKTKKKITEDDVTIALHKAQEEKMPALIMSSGEIDKNAIDYLKAWRNLVKFEKIKF